MLKKGLTLVTGLVLERLGKSPPLHQFLQGNAAKLRVNSLDAKPEAFAVDSMPRWHEWGWPSRSDGAVFRAGEVLGWKTHRNFGYRSYRVVVPELAGFGSCQVLPGWSCDLQGIDAIADSERQGVQPGQQTEGPPKLGRTDKISDRRLDNPPKRRSLRRQRRSGPFVRYLWDGRVFLADSGAAHDIARRRHVVALRGMGNALTGELHVMSIEPRAVSGLRREFEMFAVSSHDVFANVAFHDAVRKSRTPYLSKRMPLPRADVEVVFLPRNDKRSMALAAELRAADFADVGKHLSTLVLRQHMNAACHSACHEVRAA